MFKIPLKLKALGLRIVTISYNHQMKKGICYNSKFAKVSFRLAYFIIVRNVDARINAGAGKTQHIQRREIRPATHKRKQGCGSVSGSGLDPDSESGSGSRRAKMTHKSRTNFESSCFEVLDGLF
jgi:hypothetical protein